MNVLKNFLLKPTCLKAYSQTKRCVSGNLYEPDYLEVWYNIYRNISCPHVSGCSNFGIFLKNFFLKLSLKELPAGKGYVSKIKYNRIMYNNSLLGTKIKSTFVQYIKY